MSRPTELPLTNRISDGWVRSLLRNHGMWVTRLRCDLVKWFQVVQSPVSVKTIQSEIGGDFSNIYRNLKRFQRAGLVRSELHLKHSDLFSWVGDRPRSFQIVDRGGEGFVEMDPKVAAFVARALEVVEERLRDLGYTDLSSKATFRAQLPSSLAPKLRSVDSAPVSVSPEPMVLAGNRTG
jgi:hypothetical protein